MFCAFEIWRQTQSLTAAKSDGSPPLSPAPIFFFFFFLLFFGRPMETQSRLATSSGFVEFWWFNVGSSKTEGEDSVTVFWLFLVTCVCSTPFAFSENMGEEDDVKGDRMSMMCSPPSVASTLRLYYIVKCYRGNSRDFVNSKIEHMFAMLWLLSYSRQ